MGGKWKVVEGRETERETGLPPHVHGGGVGATPPSPKFLEGGRGGMPQVGGVVPLPPSTLVGASPLSPCFPQRPKTSSPSETPCEMQAPQVSDRGMGTPTPPMGVGGRRGSSKKSGGGGGGWSACGGSPLHPLYDNSRKPGSPS